MRSSGRRGRRVVKALNPAPGGGRLGRTLRREDESVCWDWLCHLKEDLDPSHARPGIRSHGREAAGTQSEALSNFRPPRASLGKLRLMDTQSEARSSSETYNSQRRKMLGLYDLKFLFQHSDCDQRDSFLLILTFYRFMLIINLKH